MLSGGSLQLTRIRGIRIGVHVSWFLILFLAILWLQKPLENRLGITQQKHRFGRPVAQTVSLQLHSPSDRITEPQAPPPNAGDAWEGPA